MIFLHATPARLAPWVELVWYSRGELTQLRERVLPSATTDIVANLGAPMRLCLSDGGRNILGTTVSGLLTRPIVLAHPPVHEAVGFRLSAHGLRAALGVPAAAVRDLVVDLPDVLAACTDELVDACLRVTDPAQRLREAVAWIAGRIARFEGTGDPLVRWATAAIERQRGNAPIAALQASSGYSATRFNRRFVDELGVTPKQYARLVRFRAALDRLDPARELAELACDLGYADQSHMNREFRAFADTTPTEVLAARYSSGLTLAG